MTRYRAQWVWFTLTLLAFGLSWLAPIWPFEQALHSSLTVLALGLMIWLIQTRQLSLRAFALFAVFIMVHCLASRWLYSNVPYDAWLMAILNTNTAELFSWQRNHFDRLVHLLYGLCLTPGLVERARAYAVVKPSAPFWRAVALILLSSLAYEWLEWLVAVLLDPADAEAYNGQQGDWWDAHKDMALAGIGALLWWPWLRGCPGTPTTE